MTTVSRVRPVIKLVKVPVSLTAPSVVLKFAVVGLAVVAQTKPCSNGLKVPKAVILPLPVAVVVLIPSTAWVTTVGARSVVKVTSSPYTVPAVLVA